MLLEKTEDDFARRARQASEAQSVAIQSGATSGIIAAGAFAVLHLALTARAPAYARLTPQLKTFFASSVTTAAAVVSAERAQLGYISARRDEIEERKQRDLRAAVGGALPHKA